MYMWNHASLFKIFTCLCSDYTHYVVFLGLVLVAASNLFIGFCDSVLLLVNICSRRRGFHETKGGRNLMWNMFVNRE